MIGSRTPCRIIVRYSNPLFELMKSAKSKKEIGLDSHTHFVACFSMFQFGIHNILKSKKIAIFLIERAETDQRVSVSFFVRRKLGESNPICFFRFVLLENSISGFEQRTFFNIWDFRNPIFSRKWGWTQKNQPVCISALYTINIFQKKKNYFREKTRNDWYFSEKSKKLCYARCPGIDHI